MDGYINAAAAAQDNNGFLSVFLRPDMALNKRVVRESRNITL